MDAYVTLVTSDFYVPGAEALARSLRRTGTRRPLVVMVTPRVSGADRLRALGCEVRVAEALPLSEEFRRLHSSTSVHARDPFTRGDKPVQHECLDNFLKLRCWEYEEFEKIVFLDADTLVVRNIDRLFTYPAFTAAPNLYQDMSDLLRMNSGVFVAAPGRAVFADMLRVLNEGGRVYRRTDQTFLEAYFPDWQGLPYVYNALQYLYLNMPTLWDWGQIRVVHYQYEKPWDRQHQKREALRELIALWWSIYEGAEAALPAPREP